MATDIQRPSLESPLGSIPPLRNGDRLSRAEFLRRYHAMPGLNHAELIEGRVCMPSPVSAEQHGEPHFDLITWLGGRQALAVCRTTQVGHAAAACIATCLLQCRSHA